MRGFVLRGFVREGFCPYSCVILDAIDGHCFVSSCMRKVIKIFTEILPVHL